MELGKFIPALCILLGFTGSSNAVDADCNYEQKVKLGPTYYIVNPEYPDYYRGERSCLWKTTSENRLKLNCTEFDIPASRDCSSDGLTIQIDDDVEYTYCGLNSLVVESKISKMNIKFHSSANSYGGRFVCELTMIPKDCQCGWKNPSRIVGGMETGVNEFPLMAGLVDLERRLLYCGATIITEKHALTAAHCLVNSEININDVAVIVGEHNVKTGDETNVTQIYRIETVTVHPQYVPKRTNDIAIVKSAKNFKFSMRVGPACLPFLYKSTNFTGETVTALGWGTLSYEGRKSDTLMKVNLDAVSLYRCRESFKNITSNMICTWAPGKDSCQFDSGGPVLWQSPYTNHLIVVGVISFGQTCADDAPGVNTRVGNYMDFIQSATSEYDYCKSF